MSRKSILILTASHLCQNPRVVKEATALGAAGYDVTVLNVATIPDFVLPDEELARRRPFRRVVLDYTRRDWVTRLRHFHRRAHTWGSRAALRWLRLESADTLGPAHALLARARGCPADLTIAHTEIPLWAARRLSAGGRRVAVDFEDWYSEDLLADDRRTRPLRLLRAAEAHVLQHAAYVSVTSASMADALAQSQPGSRPVVIRNVFPLPPAFRRAQPADSSPPAFVWFSQTIGPGRGLEEFFSAWSLTKHPSRVCLIGRERPEFVAGLLSALPAEKRTHVSVVPLIPPDELPAKLAEFDLGLALEPQWPRNKDVTISNKVFQYLAAGLALVASDTAGQREVLAAAPASGVIVDRDDAPRFAAQLDELLSNPGRLRGCQQAARAAAENEFCWEKETPRLLAAVERALASPPPAA